MNSNEIYSVRNPITRNYEIIDNEALLDLPEGTPVLRMFTSYNRRGEMIYVTVPGASLYHVNADGDLVLDAE